MGWAADAGGFAIDAAVDERLGFLRKNYGWQTGKVLAVTVLVALFLQSPAVIEFSVSLLRGSFLIFFALLIGLSLLTRKMLEGSRPLGIQAAAAGIWVVFLSLLTLPLCAVAIQAGLGHLIMQAGVLTTTVFVGLTTYVLVTKQDFSWARSILFIGGWSLVGVGILMGFFGAGVGIWYSVIWVALLSLWTLYDTSQVLHHRRTDQYVAASVDLLFDFVLMFIHILTILLSANRN
jgi:FtsH-binding integral membrane protein